MHIGVPLIIDAMSSFGAVEFNVHKSRPAAIVTSSNKCLQGVPGFSLVVCQKSLLCQSEGNARSLSLDLFDQFKGLESNGQFRFTPPTHSMLAFAQALREFNSEGGVCARQERHST
eukprot:GABW01005051.1.p1 GENE.GABW01005051.1~~GABW01005051.1.p1  ORF type:complete len:116 (-),score=17.54 GABW01005051.1:3-350(-)